jgi:hypothetical protein
MQVRLLETFEQRGHPVDKRYRYVLWPSLSLKANFPIRVYTASVLALISASRKPVWRWRVPWLAWVTYLRRKSSPLRRRQSKHLQPLAIQRDLKLLSHIVKGYINSAGPYGFPRETHADGVLAVGRKVVTDQRASTRA